MRTTLRPRVRPANAGADLDQATSTLVLVTLAAAAPALLLRMVAAIGAATESSAADARPLWAAVAAVVRMLGLGGLVVLGLACAAAAAAALRPTRNGDAEGDLRVGALYAAGFVAAAVGLALLA